jgi:hypothetical protein
MLLSRSEHGVSYESFVYGLKSIELTKDLKRGFKPRLAEVRLVAPIMCCCFAFLSNDLSSL